MFVQPKFVTMTTSLKTSTIYKLFLVLINIPFALQAQVETLDFELLRDGHIVLEMQVNDHPEKLHFILDTGATTDLIDKATAEKIGITPNYQQNATGASGSEVYDIALSQKLRLSEKIEINNSNMVLMDLSNLKSRLNVPFDGIVGASLFRSYVSKIDFENQKLSLYEKIDAVDIKGYTEIPFEFESFGRYIPIPQFDMDFTFSNGETLSGRILYDSGAGLAFLFNTPFAKENQVIEKSDKSIKSVLSGGLTGSEVDEESILLRSVSIGDFKFDSLVVGVPDSESGVSSFEGYAGLLGAEIAKRFTTIFDYSNKKMYLKPNGFFDKPFDRPLSGISLRRKEETIIVHSLISKSSAFEKGLRAGDRIISIDGDSNNDLKQYRKLLRQEGKEVKIEAISEDGTQKTISILLQPLL